MERSAELICVFSRVCEIVCVAARVKPPSVLAHSYVLNAGEICCSYKIPFFYKKSPFDLFLKSYYWMWIHERNPVMLNHNRSLVYSI